MSRFLLSGSLAVLMSLSALAAEDKDKPAKPERDGPARAVAQPDEFPDAPAFLAVPNPAPAKPTPAQQPATPWWADEPGKPADAKWWADEPGKPADAKRADKPPVRRVEGRAQAAHPPYADTFQPAPVIRAGGQLLAPKPVQGAPPYADTFQPAPVATPAPAANHQRKIYRVKHLPAIDLAETISAVIQAERAAVPTLAAMIVPEVITNSLVIIGSAPAVQSAIELAEQLDVQPKMVQVRVLIAEIHADDDGAKGIGALLSRLSNPEGDEDFNEVAAAIAGMPGVRLLGGPQLTLLDNQPGFLQIGQRVPRITAANVSSHGRLNTVEMENVGLILAVTARINDDGLVTMEVDLEKSQVGAADEGVAIAVPPEGDPIRATQVETLTCQATIAVRDGRVTVLGGLASREGEMVILISPRIVEP